MLSESQPDATSPELHADLGNDIGKLIAFGFRETDSAAYRTPKLTNAARGVLKGEVTVSFREEVERPRAAGRSLRTRRIGLAQSQRGRQMVIKKSPNDLVVTSVYGC